MNTFFESILLFLKQPLLFNSVLFFLLFVIFYGIYISSLKTINFRNVLLLSFSLFFYYKIGGPAIFILLFMGTSDFLLGKAIFSASSEGKKKLYVILSLLVNIGSLCFLKYTNFFLQSYSSVFGGTQALMLNILVPVGISFFAFRSLSYILDLYRETMDEPENNWVNYLLFISFFPLILAGPIAKARDLLPQIKSKIILSQEIIGFGFFMILLGIIKKYMIADYISINLVDRVFITPQYFGGFEVFIASFAALVQIYCDFSGYTDMMLGMAALLGFTIENNFNRPFLAGNVSDFWRRWHITFSRWMNEYLFTPLFYSFRNKGRAGVTIAILITFIASGLWHGAHWAFLAWGFAHGIAMAWDYLFSDTRDCVKQKINLKLYKFISVISTMLFLILTIILFKAGEVILFKDAAADVTEQLYSKLFSGFHLSVIPQWIETYWLVFLVTIAGFLLQFFPLKWNNFLASGLAKRHWVLQSLIIAIVIIVVFQTVSSDSLPFVYLEF